MGKVGIQTLMALQWRGGGLCSVVFWGGDGGGKERERER